MASYGLYSVDQNSTTHLLLEAAFQGDKPLLKKLAKKLDDGRGIEKTIASIRDINNMSALHLAAREGMTDMCNYLIDRCKLRVNDQDDLGRTPLYSAVSEQHIDTAKYLLNKGANPNLKGTKYITLLHLAAERGQVDLIPLLIQKGADVDALSAEGTPLHRAACFGQPEAVKVLLDHSAKPDLFLNHISSPLTAAIISKSLRCLELLLEAGADPDAISCGVTPLHYSASDGETEMTKCLIKAGADPNITDEEGMTPLEVAALNGNREDVTALYPVTTPIPSYADWRVDGIIKDVRSKEAEKQGSCCRLAARVRSMNVG